jgi:hypothetical protein
MRDEAFIIPGCGDGARWDSFNATKKPGELDWPLSSSVDGK